MAAESIKANAVYLRMPPCKNYTCHDSWALCECSALGLGQKFGRVAKKG